MEPNYIEALKTKLYTKAKKLGLKMDISLLNLYILVLLLKGDKTTNEDIHNAWAIWTADNDPQHKSLKPFNKLSKETQELDTPYKDLIIEVANNQQ